MARELLRPGQAAERWPAMKFDEAVLFHPEAGRILADATVAACQTQAAAHGAEVRFGTGPATVVADAGSSLHGGDQIKTMFADELDRTRTR